MKTSNILNNYTANIFRISLKVLETGLGWATGFLVIMSTLLAFTDGITRTFFKKGFSFFPTLEVWCIAWSSFLMAGMLIKTGEHIAVDFLLPKLRGGSQRFLTVLNSIATVAFCLLATWAGVAYVGFLREKHVTRDLIEQIPYWIVCIIIPIGMGMATLYAIGMLITRIFNPGYKE
jgi:TRAP-type C4-dicarboxylate transport system permease small subunit